MVTAKNNNLDRQVTYLKIKHAALESAETAMAQAQKDLEACQEAFNAAKRDLVKAALEKDVIELADPPDSIAAGRESRFDKRSP